MRSDLYRPIAETIIAAIKAEASPTGFGLPWHRHSGNCTPFNAISGRVLAGDTRAIFTAASRVQVAADHLVGLAAQVAAATELQEA